MARTNMLLQSLMLFSLVTFQANAQDLEALEREAAEQSLYRCEYAMAFLAIVEEHSLDYLRGTIQRICAKQIDRANKAFASRFLPPDVRFADQAIDMVISVYEGRLNKYKEMYQRR